MNFTELCFTFKVKSSQYTTDWFWANHLRGFLGMKLKRLFCIQKNTPCSKCVIQSTCPYFQMYEIQDRHWRISPPEKGEFKKGDYFQFKIVLWSDHVKHSLYVIKVMEFFKTDHLELLEVKNFDSVIYEDGNILSKVEFKDTKQIPVPENEFVLYLRTPLRIKRRKRLIARIDHDNIGYVFGLKLSKEVQVSKIFERWIDFKRFSHRQKVPMRMGGLIGRYKIFDREGSLSSYLGRGQVLGLGRARTFGFGDIHINNLGVLQG